ncbi:sulfotransferase [candidate division WOR-3 bacterium]|nr:sulfotransferase [candidate division WOR-3 bacterium]
MTSPFFILAMGRSGTKFLSSLLNSNSVKVVHERFPDILFYQLAYRSEKLADSYFISYRRNVIDRELKNNLVSNYGEVNGLLRRHCNTIHKFYPNSKIIHLVRDGRNVVRSMMSRKSFKWYDIGTRFVHPLKGDSYWNKWHLMSRFEKLCWYWMIDNKYLRLNCKYQIEFEKLISNYDYYKMNVLDLLEIEQSNDSWENLVKKPKNVTKRYSFPHWSKWSSKNKNSFRNICSDEMESLGYNLSDF